MIVVTGGNGAFGRQVVEQLLARIPASGLVVSVREPAAAAALTARGIEVRRGDFNDPASLTDAFAGAETVLINATNYGTGPRVRAAQQAAAIRAAVTVGADRVVATTWQDLDNCPLELASDFPATERLITRAGPAWTILRLCYGMAASLARDVASAVATGNLAAPAGDARATPAAVTDLAEATANVLVEAGHDGHTYELTGPIAVSWTDLAALATTLGGRKIRYRRVTGDEFRDQVVALGFPPSLVGMLLQYYAAFRAGWAGSPSTDLSRLLGRPAVESLDAVRHAVAEQFSP
jgi:NAD(P)H dehydrogenase (quinone)